MILALIVIAVLLGVLLTLNIVRMELTVICDLLAEVKEALDE